MCVALLTACTPQVPSRYIQPDEMEDILYDYHLTQAIAERGQDRKTRNFNQSLYYYAVLEKHGISEAEFDSSLVYYYTYTNRLDKIYGSVYKRLEDEAMRLGTTVGDINKYSQYSADGDTANVWNDVSMVTLMPEPPYNKFAFKIETDTTYKPADTFLFQFDADFLMENGSKEAVAYLVYKYENDSVMTYHNVVRRNGPTQLRVTSDSKMRLKEIFGFIYFGYGSRSDGLKILFADRIQLIRFHKQGKTNADGQGEKLQKDLNADGFQHRKLIQ